MSLKPSIAKQRLRQAYKLWQREKRIFYVSPQHTFFAVIKACEKAGLLRTDIYSQTAGLEPKPINQEEL